LPFRGSETGSRQTRDKGAHLQQSGPTARESFGRDPGHDPGHDPGRVAAFENDHDPLVS
jgi:hypothetical protein